MADQPPRAAEVESLRRTVWLQNDLLKTLASEEPVRSLVSRLGTLCRGTSVLYDGSGRVITSVGRGPLRLIWEEITAAAGRPRRVAVGLWWVATRPLLVRGESLQLAIASPERELVDELGQGLLETAEHVLGAATAVRDLTLGQERAEAARLVSSLRTGISTSQVRQTWDRLRAFGLRPGTALRVVAASPLGSGTDRLPTAPLGPPRPVDALAELARAESLGLLLTVTDYTDELSTPLTAVLADTATHTGPGPASAWLDELGRTHLAGVSGPFTDLTLAPHYVEEALTAWRVAARRHDHGRRDTLVLLDQVDFATWLLTRRDNAQVAARFDRHFGGLVAAPDLAETVIVYLASDQDVRRAAARLFVHPNTVRYRLGRVRRLLGEPISSPRLVANLYLAFQDEILARASAP